MLVSHMDDRRAGPTTDIPPDPYQRKLQPLRTCAPRPLVAGGVGALCARPPGQVTARAAVRTPPPLAPGDRRLP
jgi:hypothetical protein